MSTLSKVRQHATTFEGSIKLTCHVCSSLIKQGQHYHQGDTYIGRRTVGSMLGCYHVVGTSALRTVRPGVMDMWMTKTELEGRMPTSFPPEFATNIRKVNGEIFLISTARLCVEDQDIPMVLNWSTQSFLPDHMLVDFVWNVLALGLKSVYEILQFVFVSSDGMLLSDDDVRVLMSRGTHAITDVPGDVVEALREIEQMVFNLYTPLPLLQPQEPQASASDIEIVLDNCSDIFEGALDGVFDDAPFNLPLPDTGIVS